MRTELGDGAAAWVLRLGDRVPFAGEFEQVARSGQ